MKLRKILAIALCALLMLSALVGCGGKKSPIVGEWDGNATAEESWTFKDNGKGRCENSLLSYDFEYEYDDDTKTLSVYEIYFGLKSDEPVVYELTWDGEDAVHMHTDNGGGYGFDYDLTRK